MIPQLGHHVGLEALATKLFGTYEILNTLNVNINHTSMSAPQLATLLDVVHALAPNYTTRKHQCYWYALIIFLVVRNRTGGIETRGDKIKLLGKLYFLSPEHHADEDKAVAEAEYNRGWDNFIAVEEARSNNPEPSRRSAEERAIRFEEALEEATKKAKAAEANEAIAKDEAKAAREEAEAAKASEEAANQRIAELEAELQQFRQARSTNA